MPRNGRPAAGTFRLSNRAGLAACRYNVAGIAPDLRLIAPFFQGINLELADPLINNSHWVWPMSWEAALLILQGKTEGFWIHVQDTQYRPKGVQVGTNRRLIHSGWTLRPSALTTPIWRPVGSSGGSISMARTGSRRPTDTVTGSTRPLTSSRASTPARNGPTNPSGRLLARHQP